MDVVRAEILVAGDENVWRLSRYWHCGGCWRTASSLLCCCCCARAAFVRCHLVACPDHALRDSTSPWRSLAISRSLGRLCNVSVCLASSGALRVLTSSTVALLRPCPSLLGSAGPKDPSSAQSHPSCSLRFSRTRVRERVGRLAATLDVGTTMALAAPSGDEWQVLSAAGSAGDRGVGGPVAR